jgi:dTDP-4-amino-4,6-dideoxygalactose transaminase
MDAVLTAMVEDHIGPGERGRTLIQTAKDQLHFDYALALRSPATALYLALKALDLTEGQGVVLSALSPRYYAQVLADLRLTPVYADVSFSLPCISRDTIATALTHTPPALTVRCIILHHTLGLIPDTAAIAELGIPIIEDISQSYTVIPEPDDSAATQTPAPPTEPPVEPVHGVFTILGLEERDILTSGGGALLFALNRRDGSVLRSRANLPPEYCLPDLNAAMAAVQFREAARSAARRDEIGRVYTQASLRTKHKRFIPLEQSPYNNYAFPLVLETGLKDVIAYARKKEIAIETAFEQTLAGAGVSDSTLCPVSYSLSLRTVLFPLYPRLLAGEVDRVCKLILTLP